MQTFLPYKDFKKTAKVLDYKRLGKQRVEATQIINAIEGNPRKDGKPYKGWVHHPCSVMWKKYVPALKYYTNIMIQEWKDRGYNNTMEKYDIKHWIVMPSWLGKKEFHSSHRANLLRKDYEYYSQFKWKEDPKDPYVWHDIEDKWYKQIVASGERIYYGT
tara:strand:- start:2375 stop:2854 length:480 start_codon:yes stop_codon:yes gene_type:complete